MVPFAFPFDALSRFGDEVKCMESLATETERITMPRVQILDDKKYGKALHLLLSMGGMFWSRPTRTLVIGPGQLQALVDAGLVEPNGKEAPGRGKKKKKI
jgi:hypothetical protein